MDKQEAQTLLETMAIEITRALGNSGHIITEQTKLLRKQLKAIDTAIEALEKPTEVVTDCISRKRAIEIVKRAETKEIAYLALINLEPKEIPTCDECRLPECLADKQDDWVPVSETSFLQAGEYLATAEDGNGFRFTDKFGYTPTTDGGWYDPEEPNQTDIDWNKWIIAWKPLPKPYNGDMKGEE